MEALLEPTRINVTSILALLQSVPVKAIAHITGGGLSENIPRVLPAGTRARLDVCAWQLPEIFRWLEDSAGLDVHELRRTFNCGIGMILCVAEEHVAAAGDVLRLQGEEVWTVGSIEGSTAPAPHVIYV